MQQTPEESNATPPKAAGSPDDWWREGETAAHELEIPLDDATVPLPARDIALPELVEVQQPRAAQEVRVIRPGVGLVAAGLRDIGMTRAVNQDSIYVFSSTLPREETDTALGLFVVADGMGGHEGGEIASRLAISAVARFVLAELVLAALNDTIATSLQLLLTGAVKEANHAVWDYSRAHNSDMGTTCTAAVLLGQTVAIGHVGDSRAYLVSREGIQQLTSDHSAVGRLIEMGQLDPSEAREHPLRSHLFRTIGQAPDVVVDIVYQPLGDATQLVLCSDGLWSMIDDDEILRLVRDASGPHEACRALIERANAAGGDDNISAVVVTLPGRG